MIINAENKIVGRIATVAAKKALLGEEVIIINCEKAIISGNRKAVISSYKKRAMKGTHSTGPFLPRQPDRFVRRAVRGMLPYKQPRGKEAFKRIMCYIGAPEEYPPEKAEDIPSAGIEKLPNFKYATVKEICKELGCKSLN